MELENNEAMMETRHRKEKKELQAQIQSLKKTIKGDKTKKKEITTEIIRLENELEQRQIKEMDEAKENYCKVEDADETESSSEPIDIVSEFPKLKLSKAQKRRDKKSKQEKERELNIKLQEEQNKHGPRNTETLEITSKLKSKKLQLFSIPSDGDCLYKAVSHQLEIMRQTKLSVNELRNKVANYIRNNKSDFMPFMSNHNTGDMLSDTEFEEYCDQIEQTKMWGSQLEIKALSNCLMCPIQVIQATGPTSINQGEEFSGPPVVITYHRHLYQLGEHYNSTEASNEDLEE